MEASFDNTFHDMPVGDSIANPWFVLVVSDPKQAENRLLRKNMQDENDGQPVSFRMFVPYTYMSDDSHAEDHSKGVFSLRSALRRYVFVQGDGTLLDALMRQCNRDTADKMFFLRDSSRKPAIISGTDMKQLMVACSDDSVCLGLPMIISDLKPGDEFTLENTPFEKKDTSYKIVDVKRRKNGIVELQVEMTIFNIPFRNMFVTYHDAVSNDSNAAMVGTIQQNLLSIFQRRVNGKCTAVDNYHDRKTLLSIYEKRDTPFAPGAMKRHFLALMLICAQMMGQEEGRQHFREEVEHELAEIGRLRESKAATDTRAYLHVALYIATGAPQYRTLAKSYVKKYNPQSQYLRKFVTTMSKRQASKVIAKKKNSL